MAAQPAPSLSHAQTNLNAVPRHSQTLCNFRLAHSSPMQLTYALRLSLSQRCRAPALAAEQALPLFAPIFLVRQPLDRCVAILLHRPRLCHVLPLQSSHAAQRYVQFLIPGRDFFLRLLHTLRHDIFHPCHSPPCTRRCSQCQNVQAGIADSKRLPTCLCTRSAVYSTNSHRTIVAALLTLDLAHNMICAHDMELNFTVNPPTSQISATR